MDGRFTFVAVAAVDSLLRYGVESEISVTTFAAAVFVATEPSKYCSAFELMPGNSKELGVAPNVEGKKVEVVAQVRWPF